MPVRIRIEGAEELRRELLELDARFHQPLRPLLEAMGQQIASWAQGRIADSGADLRGTSLAWPELHPATRAIRRKYGHDGKPDLYRGGQLQQSIRPLEPVGADYVDVGTNLEYAGLVQHGGTTSRGGRTRTLPARPFLAITDPQADELAELVVIHLTDPDSSPEATRA